MTVVTSGCNKPAALSPMWPSQTTDGQQWTISASTATRFTAGGTRLKGEAKFEEQLED